MRIYYDDPYLRKLGLEYFMRCMKREVAKVPDLGGCDLNRGWLQGYAVVEAQWRASMYQILRDRDDVPRAEEEWFNTQWKAFKEGK